VKRTTIRIHYTSSNSETSVNTKLLKGAIIVCLCDIDFIKYRVKLTVNETCYIASFQESVNQVTVTIEGKYWYNKTTIYRHYVPKNYSISYVKQSKNISIITSTCKCMMQLELDVLCNILDQIRNGQLDTNLTDDEIKNVIKSKLFNKFYKNWFTESKYNERKLWYKKGSGKLSPLLTELLEIDCHFKIKGHEHNLFTKSFTILLSPGIVKYRFECEPFIFEHTG